MMAELSFWNALTKTNSGSYALLDRLENLSYALILALVADFLSRWPSPVNLESERNRHHLPVAAVHRLPNDSSVWVN